MIQTKYIIIKVEKIIQKKSSLKMFKLFIVGVINISMLALFMWILLFVEMGFVHMLEGNGGQN